MSINRLCSVHCKLHIHDNVVLFILYDSVKKSNNRQIYQSTTCYSRDNQLRKTVVTIKTVAMTDVLTVSDLTADEQNSFLLLTS